MPDNISDIRYEGYYSTDDPHNTCHQHTDETLKLYREAVNLAVEHDLICDGIIFNNSEPYAELYNETTNQTNYVAINL